MPVKCKVGEWSGEMKASYLTKGMYTAIVKIIILASIKGKNTYSYGLIRIVNSKFSNSSMSKEELKNEVYNITKSFVQAGYIKVKTVTWGPRSKKYYTITPKGIEALNETKHVFRNALGNIMKLMP